MTDDGAMTEAAFRDRLSYLGYQMTEREAVGIGGADLGTMLPPRVIRTWTVHPCLHTFQEHWVDFDPEVAMLLLAAIEVELLQCGRCQHLVLQKA